MRRKNGKIFSDKNLESVRKNSHLLVAHRLVHGYQNLAAFFLQAFEHLLQSQIDTCDRNAARNLKTDTKKDKLIFAPLKIPASEFSLASFCRKVD